MKPTTTHILYKQEDVRKDSIILGIFRLMDLILREEADLNLLVTTYPVVATSRDAGVLEFVPNSETLYAIQQGGYTIQNWINERNGDTKAGELRDRFVRSTAASSVISYLLGIGTLLLLILLLLIFPRRPPLGEHHGHGGWSPLPH